MTGFPENTGIVIKSCQQPEIMPHPTLKKNSYRVSRFMRHHYLMLYRIEDTAVYIDAIYHQLQDYENIFTDELNR